jgi:hypothetical protein
LATGRVGNVAQYLVGAAIGVGVGGGVGSGPGADEDLEAAVPGARHPRAHRLQSVSQSARACVSGVWNRTQWMAAKLVRLRPPHLTLHGVFYVLERERLLSFTAAITRQCIFISFCSVDKISSGQIISWQSLIKILLNTYVQ